MGHPSLSYTAVWGGNLGVKVCGIPHLAKNERDMGHPSFPLEDKSLPKDKFLPTDPA
jgi:hypothetical protein